MIEFRAVRWSITGEILRNELATRGLQFGAQPEAVVCYGVPYTGELPALNAWAGRLNKLEELMVVREAGLPTPPVSLDGAGLKFPILGRKFRHSKGRDIIPILQNDNEFMWRKSGGQSDFFVEYLPLRTEYRVWVFRNRALATYEKVMRYPERYQRIGRNFQNGFAFQYVREPSELLVEMGVRAVRAMGYDFGAVDILESMNGMQYVLEVNSAPGQENVRTGLRKLANRIVRWVERGYPERKGVDSGVQGETPAGNA